MTDVTSWFQSQLENQALEPLRKFTIGASDYSNRVTKWPKIKRTAHHIKSGQMTVGLANHDQALNNFYVQKYTAQTSVEISIGFNHPTSGDEYMPLFRGMFKDVEYAKEKANIICRDNLWNFADRMIGEPGATITFSHEIPSDIIWTVCTCYGELDNTESTSNTDIDWDSFNALAWVFSIDNVLCSAEYEGNKISTVLNEFGRYTDTAVWIEGDGKLYFKKFTEANTLDIVLSKNRYSDFQFKMEGTRIINRAYVYFDYDVSTDSWLSVVYDEHSLSVNSFGLHEMVFQNDKIWYVDSVSALTLAQRKTSLLWEPPRKFKVKSGLPGIHRQIGETVRLANDFYNVSCGQGWAITEINFDLNKGIMTRQMDEAMVANAFILDQSSLDGDDYLL